MKNKKRLIKWIVMGLLLISLTYTFAQDWPQWRGANRDGKVTGFTAPKNWPTELTQKWSVTVGAGDATPALVDGKLYVFVRRDADEVILSLDAGTGKEMWQNKYPVQNVTGPAASHSGPRSSPTVAEGKVVTLGVGGVLSCLEAATGKVVWRKDEFTKALPMFFTSMSPIIEDGTCIAHLGGKDSGELIAFDLTTGNQKWKWSADGPAYASPMMMTAEGMKQVIVQTEKNIVGIALGDGKLLWQIPTPTVRRFTNSATPIVDGQTVIFTGQGTGTKAVKIEKQGDGFGVKELWSNETFGTSFNTPVLNNGMIFGLNAKGGSLFCLNAQDGQMAWSDSTKLGRFVSVLDAGSVLLAASDSDLIAFHPSAEKYSEVAKIKVAETKVNAHPVIAGNDIYIKDKETLTLWTLE